MASDYVLRLHDTDEYLSVGHEQKAFGYGFETGPLEAATHFDDWNDAVVMGDMYQRLEDRDQRFDIEPVSTIQAAVDEYDASRRQIVRDHEDQQAQAAESDRTHVWSYAAVTADGGIEGPHEYRTYEDAKARIVSEMHTSLRAGSITPRQLRQGLEALNQVEEGLPVNLAVGQRTYFVQDYAQQQSQRHHL